VWRAELSEVVVTGGNVGGRASRQREAKRAAAKNRNPMDSIDWMDNSEAGLSEE